MAWTRTAGSSRGWPQSCHERLDCRHRQHHSAYTPPSTVAGVSQHSNHDTLYDSAQHPAQPWGGCNTEEEAAGIYSKQLWINCVQIRSVIVVSKGWCQTRQTYLIISWMSRCFSQFFSIPGTWPIPTTPTTTAGTSKGERFYFCEFVFL